MPDGKFLTKVRNGRASYVEATPTEIGAVVLGETSTTAYRGDRGKAAYDHSQVTGSNPHETTAAQVGAAESVHGHTTAQITGLDTALAAKEPAIASGSVDQYWSGIKTWVNFAESVRSTVLTGLSTASSTVVAATDSALVAIGKLQAQVSKRLPIENPEYTGELRYDGNVLIDSGANATLNTVAASALSATNTVQLLDSIATPTNGWRLQRAADHSLDLWARYAGAWHPTAISFTYGGLIEGNGLEIGSPAYGGYTAYKRGTDGAVAGFVGLASSSDTKMTISAEEAINLPDFSGSGSCRGLGINASGDVIVSTGVTTASANGNLGDIPTSAVLCSGTVILTLANGADGQGWDLWGASAYVIRVPSGVTLYAYAGVWTGVDFAPGGGRSLRITRINATTWLLPNFG